MEEINIGLSDLEPISLNFNDGPSSFVEPPSVNFGAGIELLMNDKKRSNSGGNINIDLGDLDKLESELNDLSGASSAPTSSGGLFSDNKVLSGLGNMFGFGKSEQGAGATQSSSYSGDGYSSKLGSATAETVGNTSTWDGFSKMNDIPTEHSSSSRMTDREKRRKKRLMIKKLDEWYEKGLIKNSTRFTMDSSFEEVEDEYETALEDKRKKDSTKLMGWWLMTGINSIEYANAAFDPFGINLDGWAEQVSEDIDSYDEIFAELHEKYKGGKMAPELSLLLRLGFSAAVVNFTNKALSSATPGFNDVIKQSPELMKMFTDATVSSMSQASPGFAMASNMMKDSGPRGPPPPPPVETKTQGPIPGRGMQYTERPTNRPDIAASRGEMFREESMDMGSNFASVADPPRSVPIPRPEMRGPQNTDIDNILAGLKTRTVDIHAPIAATEDDSMISITSLRDAQNGNLPKRSNRRKQRSDKNVVALDI
uniref:Uncharacterized protein n=1 Tax=viral metagenome TaxID=1070528 RepID=A0A6C0JWC7_9ZZZZ